MDPKPARTTFFSRVYAPQSANTTSHLPTTRPQASTPSFFGKSLIPHSTRRTSESNAFGRDDDDSTLPPTVDAEEHSMYAGHKNLRYFPRGIESEGSNVRHPYDNANVVTHPPYPLKSEPKFSTVQAGTPRDPVLSI